MTGAPTTQRATILGAFLEGGRRVRQAPVMGVALAALAVIVLAPFAGDVFGPMSDRLGLRTALERLMWQWHGGWALALGHRPPPAAPAAMGAALAALALSLFLSGGIIDRFARGRATYTAAFFSACGVHFWRFLRLAILMTPAWWALLIYAQPWWLGTVMANRTQGLTGRTDLLVVQVSMHLMFAAALGLVAMAADFARIRMVVEDRHSALGGLMAALRFMRRRPLRTAGLYALSALPSVVVIRLWFSAAPVDDEGLAYYVTVVMLYIVLRVAASLWWTASLIVFFQGELAHATYTAAPLPIWPDSPAAEGIRNLRKDQG